MRKRFLVVAVAVATIVWLAAPAVWADCGGGVVVPGGKEYKRFRQYVIWSD